MKHRKETRVKLELTSQEAETLHDALERIVRSVGYLKVAFEDEERKVIGELLEALKD